MTGDGAGFEIRGQFITAAPTGEGPDLLVGYAKGVRGSNESALGGLTAEVISDNLSPWSGDHCMDHETVPGILLTNRPLGKPATSLDNLAAAILGEFGIDEFPIEE